MQQRVPDLAVVQLGGRCLEAVGHAAVGIDADVRVRREIDPPDQFLILLTAEIPVVALPGGRHLGVARTGLVLGRGRRVDDLAQAHSNRWRSPAHIHQRARAQRDALVHQMRVHLRKDRFRQPVPLQEVAEVQDSGLVRDPVVAQLDPGKAPHRLAVIERLFRHRIAQGIPVLQEVDPEHRRKRHRRPPALRPDLRIMQRDQRKKPIPGHHRIHLRQKLLATCDLLLHRVTQAGKGGLFRHRQGSLQGCPSLPDQAERGGFFRRSLARLMSQALLRPLAQPVSLAGPLIRKLSPQRLER